MGAMASSMIYSQAFRPPLTPSYEAKDVYFAGTARKRIALMWVVHREHDIIRTTDREEIANAVVDNTILYSHGNSVDLGMTVAYCMDVARETNCNVVVYDYVNYGHSEQSPFCERDLYFAISSVFLNICQIAPRHNFYLYGKSLGTVPTVWLASEMCKNCEQSNARILGVILVSAIASGARTMCHVGTLPLGMQHWVDTCFADSIDRITNVSYPILFIHGKKDRIVPLRNLYDLHSRLSPEQSQQCQLVVFDAHHNDIEQLHSSEFYQAMYFFMHMHNSQTRAALCAP
jgi:pimeloyl-ACP methyl ester carboxylesterase